MFNGSSFRPFKLFLLERRFLFILGAFFLLTLGYARVLQQFQFSGKVIAIECLMAFSLLAVFSGILYRIHHYYHSKSAINFTHISTILLFSAVYSSIQFLVSEHLVQDVDFSVYSRNSFFFRSIFCFLILLSCANQFWIDKHLVLLEKRNQAYLENEKKMAQLELVNVKQQIQPHFLFNSLNSINALIGSQPKEARNMVLLLSDYLRLSIQKKESDFVSLADEISFLELYLSIEKIRFGDRLQIEKSLPENANEFLIPALILQPILENAIKYGVYGNTDKLLIELHITREEKQLKIEVSNPYDALSVASSKGTGFGLHAVRQKLKLSYGRDDLMRIDKTADRFRIQLFIPLPEPDVKPIHS